MASFAISGTTPSNETQAVSSAKAAPAQAEPTAKTASLQPDTVKLSAAAQAKMMHRQGQSAALIAATLGTDIKSVDGYLGIKIATPTAATLTAAASEPTETATKTATPTATTAAPTPAAKAE
jgi:hypothetical protein